MKAGRFPFLILLLAISAPAVMLARSYAAASQPTSAGIHPRSRAGLVAANRPKQLTNGQKRSTAGTATNFRQPASGDVRGAAKREVIQNHTFNSTPPVRRVTVARPNVLSPKNVRHRGPNPAVVGGTTTSGSSNTGAINGTRMNRRP
jgi:hypothetical protein